MLPGSGSIASRFQQWKAAFTLSNDQAHLLSVFLQRGLDEVRRRTQKLVPLPADEQVEILPVVDRPIRAIACYLGNHRSRIYLNPAMPFPLTDLSEGRAETEVKTYLMRYALMDEETAQRQLASLQRPLREAYIFTYFYGRRLLEASLHGPQRWEHLHQLLTQQILPSDLKERSR